MANNLTLNTSNFTTTGQKFGSGALSNGYGSTSTIGVTAYPVTFEGWIGQPSNPGALQVAIGSYSNGGNYWIGCDANGYIKASYVSGGSTVALNSTVAAFDGNKHHVALVLTTSGASLYVDGNLAQSNTGAPGSLTPGLGVGNFYGLANYQWSGVVDEVAVWNTARYTAAFTPPTAAYVGNETGLVDLYHLDGNGTDSAGTSTSPATAYTLTGPSSGAIGVASSPFTVQANGTLSANVVVTPSDGGAGGTFTPSTVTLTSSSTGGTFTYTPASSGTKTISTTNNGGLTNPSSLSYAIVTPVPVTSAAFHFSPANWKGNSGRGGSGYRQTFYPGAYFDFVFTAGASPTASLLLASNANSLPISYFVNGVLQDNVATASTTSLALSGLVANAVNTVRCYVRSSPFSSAWGGTNNVQVQGMVLDSGSVPGTAAAPSKWVLFGGDSINMGWNVDNGNTNFLHSASFQVVETFRAQGYDVGMMAAPATGFLGTGLGSVPALYSVSSGTYSDSASRWNKVDSGVSLLDGAGQVSAYGATGTPPAAILWNFGTNDANQGVSQTDLRTSVKAVFGAYAVAAPGAKILMVPGFPLDAGTVGSASASAAYLSTITNGFADAKAANPAASLTFSDFGAAFGQQIYGTPANIVDSFHPGPLGNAYIAPRFVGVVAAALNATSAIPFRGTFAN